MLKIILFTAGCAAVVLLLIFLAERYVISILERGFNNTDMEENNNESNRKEN